MSSLLQLCSYRYSKGHTDYLIRRSRVFLEGSVGGQLAEKFCTFSEPESSLRRLQEPATFTHPEIEESSPHPLKLTLINV
jgi:hypothetical protein